MCTCGIGLTFSHVSRFVSPHLLILALLLLFCVSFMPPFVVSRKMVNLNESVRCILFSLNPLVKSMRETHKKEEIYISTMNIYISTMNNSIFVEQEHSSHVSDEF